VLRGLRPLLFDFPCSLARALGGHDVRFMRPSVELGHGTSRPRTPSLTQNVSWGVRGALPFAVVFSCGCVVLAMFQRSITIQLGASDSVNALAVIAFYFVGAVLVGTAVGLARPLFRWRIGAAAVGAFVAIPIELAIILLVRGWSRLTLFDLATAGIFALIMGVPAGLILWEVLATDGKRSTKRAP